MSKKKKALLIGAICVAVLLILYLGFAIFFRSHFYPGTKLGELDASFCSVEQVKNKVTDGVKAYELTITESDGTQSVLTADDIDLEAEWDDSIDAIMAKQIGFDWIGKLFQPQTYEQNTLVSYSEGKLTKLVSDLPCYNDEKQVEAVDAGLAYDKKKGFYITDSAPGTVVDSKAFLQAVENKILALEPELDMDSEECYKQPIKEDSDEMAKLLAKAEKCLDSKITFDVGDDPTTLDSDTFADWISVEDGQIKLDEEEMDTYVTDLCHKYNTCYASKNFQTSYGTSVTISNVHYGWQVDYDAEYAQLTEDILSGEEIKRDLNYSMKAASHEGNDYGDSYVEANLTAQHLFLYIDGACVLETDFVSGNQDSEHYTPPGIWGITYCEKGATLRGPGYATKVGYWMPFNGDIGLHDATWRSAFGAAIYMRDGSHGCINLPGSAAATIFSYVEAGFPVIVYELPGTETEENLAQQAAYQTIDAINAIGELNDGSQAAIQAARASYDALSDLGKTYVDNLQTLLDAENWWTATHPTS